MTSPSRFLVSVIAALFTFNLVSAQDKSAEGQRTSSAPAITAAATAEGVRFTAPGSVVEMRLEVLSPDGGRVFDTGFRPRNLLDWAPGSGERQPSEGTYLCLVTVRTLSGRLSQRHAVVGLQAERASFLKAARDELTAAQTAAWDEGRRTMELAPAQVRTDGGAVTILDASAPTPALTVAAHDGRDGQVVSTQGALTLRTGDVFAGTDVERVRITEEGRVGVGTDKPETMLDVAGEVRARGGLKFPDGTTLLSASNAPGSRLDPNGDPLPAGPAAAGTGTQDRLAKWAETGGSGTLTDSALFEAGGQLGVGTTTPNPNAVLHADRSQNSPTALLVTNSNAGSGAVSSLRAGLNPANFDVDFASLSILGAGWPSGLAGLFLKGKTVLIEGAGTNFGIGNINATEPIVFYTTPRRFERMRITSAGNVGIGTTTPLGKLDVRQIGNAGALATLLTSFGASEDTFIRGGSGTAAVHIGDLISTTSKLLLMENGGNVGVGTTSPQAKLDVAGTINTSTQFNIGGQRVLSLAGLNSTFVGVNAGASPSNTGFGNSFFGKDAGESNTLGHQNSFFGAFAGESNTLGTNSSFFGSSAGRDNTTGGDHGQQQLLLRVRCRLWKHHGQIQLLLRVECRQR